MCGIFGYIGKKNAVTVCLEGLKKLEYRGYDSSGVAGIVGGEILCFKEVGKISELEDSLLNKNLFFPIGIAHTRWATHGVPSKKNAHPHLDQKKMLAVVHNGVIENYASLKEELVEKKKVTFISDTDTEVIAQLMGDLYTGDFFQSAVKTFSFLEGSFAVAVIHKDFPD
ncbi:MAG: glutamine--fructose-6-phosphate aminotransferase, partial [Chlamydiota bacterium]